MKFNDGFVEACAMLADNPYDQPTLAASLIRDAGMINALTKTKSDHPGIEILKQQLSIRKTS
jgi:hypothetical protein